MGMQSSIAKEHLCEYLLKCDRDLERAGLTAEQRLEILLKKIKDERDSAKAGW